MAAEEGAACTEAQLLETHLGVKQWEGVEGDGASSGPCLCDHLADHCPHSLSSWKGKGAGACGLRWGWSLGLLVQWGLATWCFCPPMSPREMPPGCGRGGGGTVFPELRSNQSCWQGTAGTVGRGRLAAPLRAHPPATSGEGPPR